MDVGIKSIRHFLATRSITGRRVPELHRARWEGVLDRCPPSTTTLVAT